jgi:hypothetical protein
MFQVLRSSQATPQFLGMKRKGDWFRMIKTMLCGLRLLPFFVLTSAASLALSSTSAEAQARGGRAGGNAFEIGKAGAWGIYTTGEGRAKVCFVSTAPAERLPKGLNRDPATLFISIRQGEINRPEFFMLLGFQPKERSEAEIIIGAVKFAGVGQAKGIWLKNPAEEVRLLGELRKGSSLQAKAVSQRGNDTTDRYSLTGFGQAFEQAQKECS